MRIIRLPCFVVTANGCQLLEDHRYNNQTNPLDHPIFTLIFSLVFVFFQQKYPQTSKSREQSDLNEGMEALRQIATTSLFMQNEQNVVTNRTVPIIKEPDKGKGNLQVKGKVSLGQILSLVK